MPRSSKAALARLDLRALLWLTAAMIGLAVPVTGRTAPGETEVVSVSNGTVTDAVAGTCGGSDYAHECISGDGRYVVFETAASLVPSDTNDTYDIYVRDRALRETRLVSATPGSAAGNKESRTPAISANGRYVAFDSSATDLIANDTNESQDVFVRDLITGVTERVSLTAAGTEATEAYAGAAWISWISADGRFVLFDSRVALVPSDSNGYSDVYVRDRTAGTTQRVSVRDGDAEPDSNSFSGTISDDGRFVAFGSQATNLVNGDTNGYVDVFVRDMQTGVIERINGGSRGAGRAGISGNGRYVTFWTKSRLVSDDTNGDYDIYVRDRLLETTQRASLGSDGRQSNEVSWDPAISANGQFVVFVSYASNLVNGDTNHVWDVFVRDLVNGTTERASIATSGLEANGFADYASISADGKVVAFTSRATNLGTATSGAVFVHELGGPQIKAYTLDPSSLSFGDQTITTGRTRGVAVVNTGTVPIWVGSVSASGPAASEFQLSNICHGWVQPTLRCRTNVTFRPTSVGSKVAALNVTAGGVSQSVPLSGTGVVASYTVAPESLTFGTVSVGSSSAAKTVTIVNTGPSVLPLESVVLVGTEARQFRRANMCPKNVAAGASCTVRVRFVPTAVGVHQATLAIWAGGGAGKKVVAVTGTGQ